MKMGGPELKSRRRLMLQVLVVVSASAALKLFYSRATPDELRWILAPTATLVEIVTGTHFDFEPFAGYMSADRTFLIAAACAGVNFLIAAFLMLSLAKLWRERTSPVRWRYFLFAAATAYVATIVANTTRIAIAVWINSLDDDDWFLHEQIHRFEGIIVYFGFLLALFLLRAKTESTQDSGSSRRNWEWAIFPLAIYYGLTIGIPLVNGAARQGELFWRHAAIVIFTPVIIIGVIAISKAIRGTGGDRH